MCGYSAVTRRVSSPLPLLSSPPLQPPYLFGLSSQAIVWRNTFFLFLGKKSIFGGKNNYILGLRAFLLSYARCSHNWDALIVKMLLYLGGRSWQPFGESKKGNTIFCQAHICYFCNKRVLFARNCKIANFIQHDMQYVPSNSAFVAHETLFLTPKNTFFCPGTKSSKKCVNCDKS